MELLEEYKKLRNEIYNEISKETPISKKEIKVLDTTIAFQLTDYKGTNIKVSEITGISKSSVQRYLNDKETIEKLFSTDTYEIIQKSLKENIKKARSIGGINSTKNNIVLKDEKGKFIGVKQKRIEL